MLGFDGGAIGADIYCDRSGIHGKTLADCALILDALKDADTGYYDPRDPYTTVPRSSVLSTPYSNHVCHDGDAGGLDNIRLGVIRVSYIHPAPSREKPIVDAAVTEIKDLLGGHLGATLVESGDPLWMPDPDIEQMAPDFRRALRALLPVFMPDILFRLKADGTPYFTTSQQPSNRRNLRRAWFLETAPWIPSTIVLRYRKAKLTAQQISTLPPSSNKNFLRLSVFILVNTS